MTLIINRIKSKTMMANITQMMRSGPGLLEESVGIGVAAVAFTSPDEGMSMSQFVPVYPA